MPDTTNMCTFCGQMFMPGTEHAYIVLTVLPALVKAKHTQLLVSPDQVKQVFCCRACFDALPALETQTVTRSGTGADKS